MILTRHQRARHAGGLLKGVLAVQRFTAADLMRIIKVAAGEDDGLRLEEKVLDRTFEDLGYDSLAIMETASLIEREFKVILPEETVSEIETPEAFIALVNEQLSAKA